MTVILPALPRFLNTTCAENTFVIASSLRHTSMIFAPVILSLY